MAAQVRKTAALDVGTNSVLMLVAEVRPGGEVIAVRDLARVTRLGQGVDQTGALAPEACERTIATIAEFAGIARSLGVSEILTAATSALRDARDGARFIEEVKERTGVTLAVISGEQEAELNYIAAIRGLGLDPGRGLLIVDIGGGSTEFIRNEPPAPLGMQSLRIGSVRLTERIIRHDPPTAGERQVVHDEIDSAIATLGWDGFWPLDLVGVAGTVTTICTLALGLSDYDAAIVHGARLSRAQVAEVVERLFVLTVAERSRLPGMMPGRADVICAGAAILLRAMDYFRQDQVIVSDRGVRWGLIYRELAERE